ncbi:MAG TPA: hypothetical protein DD471_12105 [Planctomycetes bacterium]|nr:hypothetical protein [Planctomycetota bacterium]
MRTLRPFIAASWHGHRDDPTLPKPVQEVWRRKFSNRQARNKQSNVDLAVLDSSGKLVHWFDGFRRIEPQGFRGGQKRESLGSYTVRELQIALLGLDPAEIREKKHPLVLPDVEEPGVRVFVQLLDDRMRAYRAPVVEAVALEKADWKTLEYPRKKRSVDAGDLKKWLAQVYPPGVMERTSQQTKMVYQISKVEGELTLEAAGSNGKTRYAILSGQVKLTDEGPGDFSYEGKLEIVLTYGSTRAKVLSLKGVFDGIYPRYSRVQERVRKIPLRAAFESLPLASADSTAENSRL